MNIEDLQNEINALTKRLTVLEKEAVSQLHQHTGFDGNKVRIQDIDTVFYKTFTYDPGSLVDGAGETKQITGVVGATLGDFVLVSAPYDLQDITVTGYVQANSVVEIRVQNESGSTVDLASGTWRVLVIKKVI